jgi:hypothetical protein
LNKGDKMTIQNQLIAVAVLIVIAVIPAMIAYYFFPATPRGNRTVVSVEGSIAKGVTISLIAIGSISMLSVLTMIIPIIGFPLMGFMIFSLIKNGKEKVKLAKRNYQYYHVPFKQAGRDE